MVTETNAEVPLYPDSALGTPIVDYVGPSAIASLSSSSDVPQQMPAQAEAAESSDDLALRRTKWISIALIGAQIVVVAANIQSELFTFWSVLFLLSPACIWLMAAIKLRLDAPGGPITRISVLPFLLPAIPWLHGANLVGRARRDARWRIIAAIFAMQMLVPLSSLLNRSKGDFSALGFNLQSLSNPIVFYLIAGGGMMVLAMFAAVKSLPGSRAFTAQLLILAMAVSAVAQSSYKLDAAFNTLSNLGLLLTLAFALILMLLYVWPHSESRQLPDGK